MSGTNKKLSIEIFDDYTESYSTFQNYLLYRKCLKEIKSNAMKGINFTNCHLTKYYIDKLSNKSTKQEKKEYIYWGW